MRINKVCFRRTASEEFSRHLPFGVIKNRSEETGQVAYEVYGSRREESVVKRPTGGRGKSLFFGVGIVGGISPSGNFLGIPPECQGQ